MEPDGDAEGDIMNCGNGWKWLGSCLLRVIYDESHFQMSDDPRHYKESFVPQVPEASQGGK